MGGLELLKLLLFNAHVLIGLLSPLLHVGLELCKVLRSGCLGLREKLFVTLFLKKKGLGLLVIKCLLGLLGFHLI